MVTIRPLWLLRSACGGLIVLTLLGLWLLPPVAAEGPGGATATPAPPGGPPGAQPRSDGQAEVPHVGLTLRVSVSAAGEQGNEMSDFPAVAAAEGVVAFFSLAGNLVDGDTNGQGDVFVRSLVGGEIRRVSVSSDGVQGNGASDSPSLSANGRVAAFRSAARNLVSGDTNGSNDIFVHDVLTGATLRASVSSAGEQGNRGSQWPSLSASGRYVTFESEASNLVPGDTNGIHDVFVHDLTTGETTRVSVDSGAAQGNSRSDYPAISGSGRYVAFRSAATNLVGGDTNGVTDIFVHDRETGETTRVSLASDGAQANGASEFPAISAGGRYVAFRSLAGNLVPDDTNGKADIFVHDRETGETTRVSLASDGAEGNGDSVFSSISTTGQYVAFDSWASNLVPGDANDAMDVFLHDRATGLTVRVSVNGVGGEGNNHSEIPAVSGLGTYVAFESLARNLVLGDTNGKQDVFVRWLREAAGASR